MEIARLRVADVNLDFRKPVRCEEMFQVAGRAVVVHYRELDLAFRRRDGEVRELLELFERPETGGETEERVSSWYEVETAPTRLLDARHLSDSSGHVANMLQQRS